MRIVIVGGVAGGMSAATRMRRLDESAEIVVIERSGHVSFANCGLPYHIGGVIERRKDLLLQTPKSLKERFNLDVRVNHEVVSIDRQGKEVVVRAADGSQSTIAYDALVLSPGARPVRPPIPGIERALSLRDIEDTDAMVAATAGVKSAAVIGGGFIGLELAENLHHLGIKVTLIEATEQVMAPLDPEMAQIVHQRLRKVGVDLVLGASVTQIGAHDVTLSDGQTRPAEVVVAAIGVRPDTALAADAGLEVGDRGGIVVDANLRTSDPSIYAVGDAVEKADALDGSEVLVPLANTANLQGRRVADIIAGHRVTDRPVLGTAIVGLFGLQVGVTGWNEKRLRASGRDFRVIHVHPNDHAGYYPGAAKLSIKLLVDAASDAVLGAQAVGRAGVDKRIDVIATAMTGGIKASELAELELAYAPQFGSAKDPINMLGYIAENLRDGVVETVQWHELADEVAAGASVIDVRTAREFAKGGIPGALNLPLDELRERQAELPAGRLIVNCEVGLRGHTAARLLSQLGREVANLDGGYLTWKAGVGDRVREGAPTG
ncbi:MAG: FAD-dependent oxidoreductase [Nocardioidaceae bacterium]|nr:FAD-dependent oxidoreductase [Marmoricola sp.]